MAHRRQLVAIGLLLLAVSLVRGTGSPASAVRRGAPTDATVSASIMVVGDSIMRSAVAPLQSRLVDRPGGRAATFNASGGLGVDDSRYVSSRIAMGIVATGGFDAIVINLGVNDTLAGYVTQDPAFHMRRILDAAGTTPVLWLNQAETLPNHEVAAVAYNAALRTSADQYSNLTIVDWGAVLDQHREYLDPDNLHLNPRGQSVFAQMASDAIDAEVGA